MAGRLLVNLIKLAIKIFSMNKLFFFLLLPLASFGQTAEKEFKIKGQLKFSKPIDWIYLRYVKEGQYVTDSIQPQNGEFKFEGKIAEPLVANLIVKYAKEAGSEKAKSEYTQFFLEPSKIEIRA